MRAAHQLTYGWRTRGYLPHHDAPGAVQHIVFRLSDALPRIVVERLRKSPVGEQLAQSEAALDEGLGSRALADAKIAEVVSDALQHFNSERYVLIAWCVMPTHVHVLAETRDGWPTSTIVQGWKSVSSRRANAILGQSGRFWAPEYFDRTMRDFEEVERTVAYIENNPVVAALCGTARDWIWSSACAATSRAGEDARATEAFATWASSPTP